MRAVVYRGYGPPEVLRMEDVRRPEHGDHELLIRNHASVVSSAECQARAATPAIARLHFGLAWPKWPILGATFSGTVEAAGSGVTRYHVGDGGDEAVLGPPAAADNADADLLGTHLVPISGGVLSVRAAGRRRARSRRPARPRRARVC